MDTHKQGQSWEGMAAGYLVLRGYRILERNYRTHLGEIDLIIRRGKSLVFVEVKGRQSKAKGSPLEAVSPRKVKRLSAAAALYLASSGLDAKEIRFDVVALGPDRNWLGRPKIRHYQDAFPVDGNFNV